ncbi:hypothetical protein Mapa_011672 [Marchantia paleacea]|nr:hypothetical protein Mapa_011672 [Marchantia paleacea]
MACIKLPVIVILPLLAAAAHGAFEDNSDSGSPNGFVCAGASRARAADGTQQADQETCSSIQLGEIPTSDKMTTTLIVKPKFGETIERNKKFEIKLKLKNLETGFFSDPNVQYYSFSQQLNNEGKIKGHTHVVIQRLDSNSSPPDARNFDFFKGLNDAANHNDVLTQSVDEGLDPGTYRLCTMASSFSHQAVIMPIAQRGPQDDCTRFIVE